MRIGDRLFGPLLALFGLLVIWGATRLPKVPGVRFGADLLPMGIGIALVGLGLLVLLSGLRRPGGLLNVDDWKGRGRDGLAAAWSLGGLLIGMVLFEPLGFPLFGMLFMAVMMALMGARWPVIAVVSPTFILLLYYVFSGLLRVSLPAGPLGVILP
ncbi:tripartite tricarboxylate transporter TctB family protein [Primorskyibacter sp. 2E107]|uniref:tripartite tricarboxylate transporter TctB family protein n=1 Tax=Primorskyibacter sp. 2E107 TaxID=3403458 RepID=UPI003AF940BD